MQIDFNSSPGPSLGIEVELEVVDAATGALASAATDILTELGADFPDGEHPKAKHELFECTRCGSDPADLKPVVDALVRELATDELGA